MRNPPWQRDELILALDLYFRVGQTALDASRAEVVELSKILNTLQIHGNKPNAEHFRNPNSVAMKLSNFLRFDPDYKGKGLERGNRLEKGIWDEFAPKPAYLRKVSQSIINNATSGSSVTYALEEEDEFPEGKVLYRQHRIRERNRKLATQVKNQAAEDGNLFCSICGFDFNKTYGDLGKGYIECHHTVPISEYADQKITKISDLVLVCSNCHAMLHRRRPWLSVHDMNSILNTVD